MSNSQSPIVSVILPVYNAEKYLREAIDSILSQTFSDFELIIINDGSSDRSSEIACSYSDSRIIYIEQQNAGLAATLNRGIGIARGEFIARQDNDDISDNQRLRKQVDYLVNHPEVMLLGTGAEIIDENGLPTGRYLDHGSKGKNLKFHMLFNNHFVHSSVMIRRTAFEKAGIYKLDPDYFEDHNLWSRIARVAEIHNLPDRLLKYREVHSSMSRTTSDYMQKVVNQATENILFYCPEFSRREVRNCVQLLIGVGDYTNYQKALKQLKELLQYLASSFATREKSSLRQIKEECKKLILNFKRHYYNSAIEHTKVNPVNNFYLKLKRKLFFIRYNRYLT
jgi:glycosyltransferase involved in cell wall biosynthesis